LSGTATPGSDYVSIPAGTLTFSPGDTTKRIDVAIIGDTIFEPDENFFVKLTNPSGAILGADQATGLIQNDDPPPTLSINSAAVKEGDIGTVNDLYRELTGVSRQPVTVGFTTASTAAADIDFVSTNGTLTFHPERAA
jgi:hypothetical protein